MADKIEWTEGDKKSRKGAIKEAIVSGTNRFADWVNRAFKSALKADWHFARDLAFLPMVGIFVLLFISGYVGWFLIGLATPDLLSACSVWQEEKDD